MFEHRIEHGFAYTLFAWLPKAGERDATRVLARARGGKAKFRLGKLPLYASSIGHCGDALVTHNLNSHFATRLWT
jgi:hypothetical protein